MNKPNSSLKFIRVKDKEEHITALYDLLKTRIFNISNTQLPSPEEHKNFVINNPYRAWYLIEKNKSFIGSVYLLKNNCVGIYVSIQEDEVVRKVINWIHKYKKPLPEIKSIRAPYFHVNLSPDNFVLAAILQDMHYKPVQVTWSLQHKSI